MLFSKKDLINFKKKNKIKIVDKISKNKLLIVDRALPEQIIINSLSAYAFNKKLNYNCEVITELSDTNDLISIYKSFGMKKISNVSLKANLFNIEIIIKTFFIFIYKLLFLIFSGEQKFKEEFKVFDIFFGDLIYDSYIYLKGYKKYFFLNFLFIKILFLSLYKITFLHNFINKNNYKTVLISSQSYASISAISLRIALKKKIRVLNILNGTQFNIYKKLNESFTSSKFINKKILNEITKDVSWKKKTEIYLNHRFKGGLKDTLSRAVFKTDDFKIKKKIGLIKKRYKRVGLFFLHRFYDANHSMGKMIFKNFYDQMIKTLEILRKDKKTFWLIKIHPSSYIFKDEIDLILKKVNKFKSDNISILKKKTDNLYLITSADIIITGRGTVALESAIFGKKTICSGESYFSKFGICELPKNIDDYEKLILNYKKNFKLNKYKVDQAYKIFYYRIFENSKITSDIFPFYNQIKISIKKKIVKENIFTYDKYRKKTYKNYFKIVNKKTENKSFVNDKYFKSLSKFILENFK